MERVDPKRGMAPSNLSGANAVRLITVLQKRGRQKGVGHSHSVLSLFGNLFLMFGHFSVTFSRFWSPFCLSLLRHSDLKIAQCISQKLGVTKKSQSKKVAAFQIAKCKSQDSLQVTLKTAR